VCAYRLGSYPIALATTITHGPKKPCRVGMTADPLASVGKREPRGELCGIFGDGVYQAAALVSGATSIPSRNVTPLMTFGN
jgi:hypothetical protein